MANDEKQLEQLEEVKEEEKTGKKIVINLPEIDKEEVVETIKETTEKAAAFVGDAAKEVADFAGAQLKNAKSIFEKVSKEFSEGQKQQKLKKYNPIFLESFDGQEYVLPKMISVINYDKRKDMPEFQNALGYQQNVNQVEMYEIYKNESDFFGIKFLPDLINSVYLVNPADPNSYIEISKYFNFLNTERIAELTSISQALGAKHFKVTILEEVRSDTKKAVDAKVGLGVKLQGKASVDVSKSTTEKQYQAIKIAVDSKYIGKAPTRPELKYWAGNTTIENLIERRLASDNTLLSETFQLESNFSSGLTVDEAAKIDGALKAINFKAAGHIADNVKKEERKIFEYLIEFE